MGGTVVMTSIDRREPIRPYDLNRNKSPRTKPISPDIESQNHCSPEASVGKAFPRVMEQKILRNKKAKSKRMMFTANDPTLLPAYSNANAVIVQKKATAKAANSPICDVIL